MGLHPFQRTMLEDYFDGVTETVILISKKNGKTTLLSALALHHLLVTPDAECVIAAASRDQAQILLSQARGFVRRSGLGGRLQVKQREIVKLGTEGRVRVLASDSDTADGVIPTLAIVDELHRHKDKGAMYGVFHDGLGPRNGQIVTISTAGEDEDSVLGALRRSAREHEKHREGAYRYARSDDFAMHEWALDPTDDRDDLDLVALANPAPWQDVEALRKRKDSPSMTPARWARFACGVWMRSEDTAITAEEWHARATDERIPEGEPVWVGADFGWKWDTTAVVPLWMPEPDKRLFGVPEIVVPPRDGSSTLPEDVQAAFLRVHERNPIHTVVMDENAGGAQMAGWLEDTLGAQVVAYAQSHAPMALAYERWMEAMREGWLWQPGDPEFTRHVLNAVAKTLPGGQARFDRPARSRSASKQDVRVWDALTAASIVHSYAVENSRSRPFVFEVF
jgi:phage terminase large subunit-like protein